MNELLKKAKESNGTRIYSDEEIELVVAYIQGEISSVSVANALSKGNATAVRSKVVTILKQAVLRGKIRVDLV